VILTNRSSTTGGHADFTAIGIDGRRRLVGVCNRHAVIEKIIYTVTVGIDFGCNEPAGAYAESCIVGRLY
jgi:hypothetical protein